MRQAEEALKYGIDELSRRALLEECNRYRNALMEIAADAAEAPMEDMLGAGQIAREALR